MKIGVITNALFSHGGVERVTSTVLNELSKNNEIEIIYTGELSYNKEKLYGLNEKKINIVIKKLQINICEKLIRKIIKIINNRTAILNKKNRAIILEKIMYPNSLKRTLITFLNEKQYDVIIAVQGENSLLLASIANDINAKTIGWQHNSYKAYYHEKYKYSWNKEELAKSILPRLDKVIVLTDKDKRKYKDNMNIDAIRVYNPLSFSSYEKSTCDNNTIISVGRLVKQKGFDLLINAFSLVSDKHPNVKLNIIGEGEDKEHLSKLIEENNLNNRVEIRPFTNDIANEYLKSDFFVSSSRWEGFGLVITEAMECGLPVISFRTDGPEEIINNYNNGILVECENIRELANAMMKLLDDKKLNKEYSEEAIRRAGDFKVESINRQWQKICEF